MFPPLGGKRLTEIQDNDDIALVRALTSAAYSLRPLLYASLDLLFFFFFFIIHDDQPRRSHFPFMTATKCLDRGLENFRSLFFHFGLGLAGQNHQNSRNMAHPHQQAACWVLIVF